LQTAKERRESQTMALETKREANSLDVEEGTSYTSKKLREILKYNPDRFENPVFQQNCLQLLYYQKNFSGLLKLFSKI
jgi:hypothetical protein